jgi:tRNA pseudouridine55 synthase
MASRADSNMQTISGIINIDKPARISSARVVGQVKRLLPRGTKIGHAGTLDPFATGVLLLLVGKATKLCESLMDAPKQYEATIKLGATTPTEDPTSEETPWPDARPVSIHQVQSILPNFVGVIQQRPSSFSALKVGGRRAYDIARKGGEVALAPRAVRVDAIELSHFEWPLLKVRVDCGRGTYIRALARDIGEALQTGGYLTQLRRTRVGQFWVKDSSTVDRVTDDGAARYLLTSDSSSSSEVSGHG